MDNNSRPKRLQSNRRFYSILVIFTIFFTSSSNLSAAAANEPGYWFDVQTLEARDLGLSNLSGLGYLPESKAFFSFDPGTGQVAVFTMRGDLQSTSLATLSISNPLNLTYYPQSSDLVTLDGNLGLMTVGSDILGSQSLQAELLTEYQAVVGEIQNPQGLTYNPIDGSLYILDATIPEIVKVTSDQGFRVPRSSSKTTINSTTLNDTNLEGLAFNPQDGFFYTYSLDTSTIYAVDETGVVISTFDLTELKIGNFSGITFAPSSNPTDGSTEMNLFLTDSGSGQKGAAVIEIDITETILPDAVIDATLPATVVNVIDASLWSPPSPDSAGLEYLLNEDQLLVVDSEVDEEIYWANANSYEATNTGTLEETCDLWNKPGVLSKEPTGAAADPATGTRYISDDNQRKVFIIELGPDGIFCTGDDITSSINTLNFGPGAEGDDPEGIAYGDGHLFVTDGLGGQVYVLTPGPNGIFDGVSPQGDDLITDFDTNGLGLDDPEGIGYHWVRGTVFIVSRSDDFVVETTIDGTEVNRYSIKAFNIDSPAGLAIGPSSTQPGVMSVYISQRGIDNSQDPNENDGKIFEIDIGDEPSPVIDLSITKTDSNTEIRPGSPTTYTIVVTHNGPDGNLVTGAHVQDTFPTSLTNISWICSVTGGLSGSACGSASGTGDIDELVNLADGSTATFTVTATVSLDATGEISNTATVTAPATIADLVPGNDSATDSTIVLESGAYCASDTGLVGCWPFEEGSGSVILDDSGSYNDGTVISSSSWSSGWVDSYALDLNGTSQYGLVPDAPSLDVTNAVTVTAWIKPEQAAAQELIKKATTGITDGYELSLAPTSGDGTSQKVFFRINEATNGDTYRVNSTSQYPTDGTWMHVAAAFDGTTLRLYVNGTLESSISASGQSIFSNDASLSIGAQPSGGSAIRYFMGQIDDARVYSRALSDVEIQALFNNNPPAAVNDDYSTPENTSLIVNAPGVIGNDSDPDGDAITAVKVTDPSNGSVTLNSDGSFTYTPNTDYAGLDNFTYHITDGNLKSSTATVNIDVININIPPVAQDDTATTNEDAPVVVSVLDNDSDPDLDILTITLVSDPANGTATITNAGTTVTYTPDLNYNGLDNFTYTISDSQGGTDTATVTMTVNPVNDPPAAVDDILSTTEDTEAVVLVLDNDSDIDLDALSVTIVSDPANGTTLITGAGTTVTYTPDLNYFGSDSFTYTISDGQGGTDTATVSVTVNSVNDPPVAVNDNSVTNEDTPVVVSVLDNDSDVELDILTVTLVTNPVNGTAIITDAGTTVTYTPDPNFSGSDSYTYTISDGQGGTDTATVNVTINPVNDPPVAVNDVASTSEDTEVVVSVLVNDSDIDLDTLSVTIVSAPANGSTVITGAGTTVTYTPNLNYFGPDSFTYTISDGQGGTDTASVGVTVNPVNDFPQAADDNIVTNEDIPVIVYVLDNDTDVDLDVLTVTFVGDPANGTALITNANTTVTYTPDPNYNGLDSFTYTISDGQGGIDTASVSMTVNPVNDPPVAMDDIASTPKDTPIVISVLDNDSDVDLDTLTVTIVSNPANGTATINDAGTTITYTPDLNYNGPDSFTYTISDGQGGTDTATVDIAVNNLPPVAQDDTATTDEDTAAIISVLSNDTDANLDPLIITFIGDPANGTAAITDAGTTVTYTPDPNYNGPDSFTYTISDGQGGTDSATVSMTVNPVNDPPAAVDDNPITAEDNPVVVSVLDNDSDIDLDALTVTFVSAPANGTAVITGAGTTVSYTPDPNYNGADSFTYTISDGQGGNDTAMVNVTVTQVNDLPVAVNDVSVTDEDTPVVVSVLDNDSDVDLDTLIVTLVSDPTDGTALITGAGTTVTYTPDLNYNGSDNFTYTISDGQGGTDIASVSVTVNAVNDPPTANNDAYNTPEDTPLTITALGIMTNDTDPESDSLSAIKVTDPASGSLTIDADGSFTYIPNNNFNGEDSFTYYSNDGAIDSNVATVTITVDPINDNPVAADDTPVTDEDTGVVVSVLDNDSDVDLDILLVTFVSNPANGTALITGAGTTVTYTPDPNYNGTDSFTYNVSDGQGGTDTATVNVTVNPINDPPVAVDDNLVTNEDTQIVAFVLNNDTDVDLDMMVLTLVTSPENGTATITNAGSTVTYMPDPNYFGSDSFTYTISDGNGGTDTATVSVTVNPVNDPPIAVNDLYNTSEDTPLSISVPGILTNDTDPETDPLTAIKVTNPVHGTLTFNSDGSFTYTPNPNYAGPDSFTYKANDGNLDSNLATVNIAVGAANDAPIANNDNYSTDEDTPLSISSQGVLVNDTDPESDPLMAFKVTNPANGSVTLNSNGSLTYIPNTNFNGEDSFTYKANDGTLDSNAATVTITIDPINDFPIAVDDHTVTDEDIGVNVSVLDNDSDVELDTLTITLVSDPAYGTATITNAGTTVTYTPDLNYNGPDNFTYTISDGQGGTDTAVVNVAVNSVNDPPTAVDDNESTNQDTTLEVFVLANDSDIELNILTVTSVSDPANGSAVITNAGTTVTYTPDPFYSGPDSFTYTISDGNGGTNTATVNITVISTIVDTTAPTISFITPFDGGTLSRPRAILFVNASDAETAVERVEFEAFYDGAWQPLGTDYDPADGWKFQWATGQISDRYVSVRAIAYDYAGHSTPESVANIELTSIITNGSSYQYREGDIESVPIQQSSLLSPQTDFNSATILPDRSLGMFINRILFSWWKYLIY